MPLHTTTVWRHFSSLITSYRYRFKIINVRRRRRRRSSSPGKDKTIVYLYIIFLFNNPLVAEHTLDHVQPLVYTRTNGRAW